MSSCCAVEKELKVGDMMGRNFTDKKSGKRVCIFYRITKIKGATLKIRSILYKKVSILISDKNPIAVCPDISSDFEGEEIDCIMFEDHNGYIQAIVTDGSGVVNPLNEADDVRRVCCEESGGVISGSQKWWFEE